MYQFSDQSMYISIAICQYVLFTAPVQSPATQGNADEMAVFYLSFILYNSHHS